MYNNKKIQLWDQVHVQKHLYSVVNETQRYLKNKKNLYVIDVGANTGAYVDHLIEKNSIVKAILFEPQPGLYNYMVEKYKHLPEIIVENYALSDSEQCYRLNDSSFNYHINHLHEDDPNFNLGLTLIKYTNEPSNDKTKSFDQLRHQYNLERIDVIKIDTEGEDFRVLNGFTETLNSLEIKPLIIFEMNWFMSQSYLEAQKIFDEFCIKTGYINNIDLNHRGDFVLTHPNQNFDLI